MDNQTTPIFAEPATTAIPVSEVQDAQVRQSPKPVRKEDRIQTVDMVRGFALLGILLMNIPGFGIEFGALYNILIGPQENADFKMTAIILSFFDGTMRGLFSMLFGAGMVLFTLNKKDVPGGPPVAEYYYRRLLWLVAFGLFNAYVLLWFGDILYFYGLIGMLLYPFRKTSAKWLLVLGLVCIGIGMWKNMWSYNETRQQRKDYLTAIAAEKAGQKLTPEQEEAKATWIGIEKSQAPNPERSARNVERVRSGYGTVWNHFLPWNAGGETWWLYHGVWDMLSMMFIGMDLLALGFFSNKLSTGTYWMTLLLGYGIGLPLGWIIFKEGWVGRTVNFAGYIDSYRVPHQILYDLRRILICLGHASVLLLVFRSRIIPWLMKGLANVGQMAFTNYLMQSIICTFIFYGYGFGYYNEFRFYQLYYVVGAVWIFQLIFSSIWLRYYRFGPFEWLWRSLTYWEKQKMRK